MTNSTKTINTTHLIPFWVALEKSNTLLEKLMREGDAEGFKKHYDMINALAQKMHPTLQVEFGADMMAASIQYIVITLNEESLDRTPVNEVMTACPPHLKELVTSYKLPAVPWEAEITEDWYVSACQQFGFKDIAPEVGRCLSDLSYAIKQDPKDGLIFMQVGFKNPKEKKAVGQELIKLMLELQLGEQIVSEVISNVLFTLKKNMTKEKDWVQVNGLKIRDAILINLV